MCERYEKCGGKMSEEETANIYGTVKVGDRGQIVIPAQARKDLNIKPGDLLLVMSGKNKRGLGIVKAEMMRQFVNRLMHGLEEVNEEK